MQPKLANAAAVALATATLVSAQTSTDCNPLQKCEFDLILSPTSESHLS